MPPSQDSNTNPKALRRPGLSGDVVEAPQRKRPVHDDDPTQADIERFSNVTRTCSECNKEVFDDAEVCYHCGHAFTSADRASRPRWWIVVVVVLVIAAFALLSMRVI